MSYYAHFSNRILRPTLLRSIGSDNLAKKSNKFACIASFRSYSNDSKEFEDVAACLKLITRTRRLPDEMLKPEHRSFRVSRTKSNPVELKHIKLGGGQKNPVYIMEPNRNIFTSHYHFLKWAIQKKILLMPFIDQLPSLNDLAEGNKMLFSKILKATVNNSLSSLSHVTLGGSEVLKELSNSARKLTDYQKKALLLFSPEDFIGRDGLILNDSVFNLDQDEITRYLHYIDIVSYDAIKKPVDDKYLRYSVYLMAVGKKNKLYKLVRLLPYRKDNERMLVSLPPDYGFTKPKYTIMRIDVCHKIYQNGWIFNLDEDCLLYDFDVTTF